jgi:predicted Zn-dependent protease
MTSLEALRKVPDSSRYLLTYLQIIRKTKAKPDVVAEIRKYRGQYPKNADLVLLLARIYAEPDGDSDAARRLYDLFFQMAPNHPDMDRARYEARGI